MLPAWQKSQLVLLKKFEEDFFSPILRAVFFSLGITTSSVGSASIKPLRLACLNISEV